MRKGKRGEDKEKDRSERWLLTYADMMNNLLILFMVLYAMSVIDAQKFETLAAELANTFSDKPMTDKATQYTELQLQNDSTLQDTNQNKSDAELKEEFEKLYQMINTKLKENGYDKLVSLDKGDNFIRFRFGDNVLFYPDSPQIKTNDVQVLKYIGDMLASVNSLIATIEIGGHTATTGQKVDTFFSWELSSDRALAVLEYLVSNCNLPEAKMSVSGYSRYHPVAKNDTEANRQLNRRVEITITRVTAAGSTSKKTSPSGSNAKTESTAK